MLDEIAPLKEKLDNAELVWAKLEENPTLYDLVIKHLQWEPVDLNKFVELQLWEELNAINNSLDSSSDAIQPVGKSSLQDRMMQTNARVNL